MGQADISFVAHELGISDDAIRAVLLVDKTVSAHATVAVARHAPRGRLALVGLGPGARELLEIVIQIVYLIVLLGSNAGRTVGLVECDVTTADGKVAAYAVSTCMVLRGEAAQGR